MSDGFITGRGERRLRRCVPVQRVRMASDLACPLAAERRLSCRAPTAAAWAGKLEPAPQDPKEMHGNDRGKNICVRRARSLSAFHLRIV